MQIGVDSFVAAMPDPVTHVEPDPARRMGQLLEAVERGPTGALLVEDPATVTEKIVRVHRALGGVTRLSFQMSPGILSHARELHAVELLGTHVAPMVRESLAPAVLDLPRAA